jgi:hypothetical protein
MRIGGRIWRTAQGEVRATTSVVGSGCRAFRSKPLGCGLVPGRLLEALTKRGNSSRRFRLVGQRSATLQRWHDQTRGSSNTVCRCHDVMRHSSQTGWSSLTGSHSVTWRRAERSAEGQHLHTTQSSSGIAIAAACLPKVANAGPKEGLVMKGLWSISACGPSPGARPAAIFDR